MNGDALQRELVAARAQIEHQQVEHRAAFRELQDSRDAMLFMLEDLEIARKKIEHSHQEWMAALDVVNDPIFLHDKEFRILRCNKAYQLCAGIPFHEIIGRIYYEVFPKSSTPMACCLRAMEKSEEDVEEVSAGEVIYSSRAFSIHDEQGVYLYSVHTLEDITKRKRDIEALRASERRFFQLANSLPQLVWTCQPDGPCDFLSQQWVNYTGIPEAEQLEYRWLEQLHPDDRPSTVAAWQAASASGEDFHVEFRIRRHDGVYRWFDTQAVRLRDEEGRTVKWFGSNTDITNRKQHELDIWRANRALRTLSAGNQTLIHSTDEQQLLQAMCSVAVEKGGYRMAWVGFVENDTEQSIRPVAQAGFEEGYLENSLITWVDNEHGQGPTGRAVRTCAIQVAQDIALDPKMTLWRTEAMKRGYASSIALPLLEQGRCFGVLSIYAAEADSFDDDEIKLLKEMASDLAFGILTLRIKEAHREHEQRLQKNMLQTVEAIASIVEMRDPYTSGHQARVAEVARSIAHRMGLSEEMTQVIHLAGLVHDLGKIAIPAEILSKPGRLNDIEYSLIKMHPQAGFDILKDIDFSWPIAQMVLQHHERLDGSGYPHSLKGDEILLGARILCVADVVEAMSSHRPYRPGLGVEAAMDEIKRGRGLIYDAKVVDACVSLIKEQGYAIPA